MLKIWKEYYSHQRGRKSRVNFKYNFASWNQFFEMFSKNMYLFHYFQSGAGIAEVYIELINKNGEGRLLWTLNERPSEDTWHEGQVEIRAHGEEEFQVSGFFSVTYKDQLKQKLGEKKIL